jgi:hypothetical protein
MNLRKTKKVARIDLRCTPAFKQAVEELAKEAGQNTNPYLIAMALLGNPKLRKRHEKYLREAE